MSSETEERSNGLHWSLGLLILLAVLYVLSVGPAVGLFHLMGWDRTAIGVVYAPLVWVHEETPLGGPLERYVKFWVAK